jgi:hypothetical protein
MEDNADVSATSSLAAARSHPRTLTGRVDAAGKRLMSYPSDSAGRLARRRIGRVPPATLRFSVIAGPKARAERDGTEKRHRYFAASSQGTLPRDEPPLPVNVGGCERARRDAVQPRKASRSQERPAAATSTMASHRRHASVRGLRPAQGQDRGHPVLGVRHTSKFPASSS